MAPLRACHPLHGTNIHNSPQISYILTLSNQWHTDIKGVQKQTYPTKVLLLLMADRILRSIKLLLPIF